MPESFVSVDLSELSPREAYSLLVEAVIPRPIAFVSTISAGGVPNLAPFSFFMMGGASPPSVAYSPTLNRDGRPKDSLRNVEETGEFVINTVHREIAEEMNRTSASYPSEVSEWDHSELSPIPSDLVRPMRVAQSLVQFECKVFQIVRHGSGPTSAAYVIGEVVRAHYASELFEEGKIRHGAIQLLGRVGRAGYLDLADSPTFDMERPP
jgi:flavin reductase (DIM6/NTAB) family NADH-FMN oxidoreductase RutF